LKIPFAGFQSTIRNQQSSITPLWDNLTQLVGLLEFVGELARGQVFADVGQALFNLQESVL
jgi:hypothetical protein